MTAWLRYTHHGPFALDHHGIYRDLTFSQHYVPQIRAVGLYLAKLVGEVLYLQSVRAQCGTYLEAPLEVGGCLLYTSPSPRD